MSPDRVGEPSDEPDAVLATVVREEWGRLTSLLLARFRRLDLVEDALADAVETATRRWTRDGAPDNPAAWLHTAARRRVLDRLRAESMAHRKAPLLVVEAERDDHSPVFADPGDLVEDDLLRLVLMCSHPALDPSAASALTLRLVLGVSTADIARLFLVPEPTMAARITRAKRKIVTTGIPFAVPSALAQRSGSGETWTPSASTSSPRPPTSRSPPDTRPVRGRMLCALVSPARRSGWSGSCSP